MPSDLPKPGGFGRGYQPIRPRRLMWIFVSFFSLLFGYIYFFPTPEGSYHISPLARKPGPPPPKIVTVEEIHGLLHFVTSPKTSHLRLNEIAEGVDWSQEVDLDVYAGRVGRRVVSVDEIDEEEEDWQENVRRLFNKAPLVVFSKTTCPYSKKAKNMLMSYNLYPRAKIIELDQRSDGSIIKQILTRLTGRGTVPNILLTKQPTASMSIGGSDDIIELHHQKKLKSVLEAGGITVKGVRSDHGK